MTKTKLINMLQAEMGLPRRQVDSVVSGVFTEIKTALEEQEVVKIAAFGRFEIKTRAPHRGRDPVSGEIRVLPPLPSLHFSPSRLLKNKVNNGKV